MHRYPAIPICRCSEIAETRHACIHLPVCPRALLYAQIGKHSGLIQNLNTKIWLAKKLEAHTRVRFLKDTVMAVVGDSHPSFLTNNQNFWHKSSFVPIQCR